MGGVFRHGWGFRVWIGKTDEDGSVFVGAGVLKVACCLRQVRISWRLSLLWQHESMDFGYDFGWFDVYI